jgi:hypothetical protein
MITHPPDRRLELPEPKTDTTAQLGKRFLQPTRSVGRFLQPTQSECISYDMVPSPYYYLVLNQRTSFFCGQPRDPNSTMSLDTFLIPLVPPLPSTPAPLNNNTHEGVLPVVASPNSATTPNNSHQRSKITVDASPKLPPPHPFSDCLPLCRRRNRATGRCQ